MKRNEAGNRGSRSNSSQVLARLEIHLHSPLSPTPLPLFLLLLFLSFSFFPFFLIYRPYSGLFVHSLFYSTGSLSCFVFFSSTRFCRYFFFRCCFLSSCLEDFVFRKNPSTLVYGQQTGFGVRAARFAFFVSTVCRAIL